MVNVTKVYLDTCIFVAYLHKKHPRHKDVSKCLKSMKDLVSLKACASDWCINEMIKVLIKDYKYGEKVAENLANKIFEKGEIGGIKFTWVKVDSAEKYSFKEFFQHLTKQLVAIDKFHLADAIHSVIMINNNVDHILTTDRHFQGLQTFTSIDPKLLVTISGEK